MGNFGTIPLGLLSVIPGIKLILLSKIPLAIIFMSLYLTSMRRCNGIIILEAYFRIPFMRKLNWREIIGVRGVYGTISDANRGINASGLQYMAPENVYWEYSAGIETSSKCFVSILPGEEII
jgi:hypothetical protein